MLQVQTVNIVLRRLNDNTVKTWPAFSRASHSSILIVIMVTKIVSKVHFYICHNSCLLFFPPSTFTDSTITLSAHFCNQMSLTDLKD
jgi:hypothetical protein